MSDSTDRVYVSIFDAHHGKTELKVVVVVIPKEGWARKVCFLVTCIIYELE